MKTPWIPKVVLAWLLMNQVNEATAQNWVSNNVPGQRWSGIASSADGSRLLATAYGGYLYSSTNSGASWTTNGIKANWNTAASAADGMNLAAGIDGGGIYLSTNGGAAWNLSSAPSGQWMFIASSADGTRLWAGNYSPGNCYYSTNSGATWNIMAKLPSGGWASGCCSADGIKLLADQGKDQGPLLISTNAGISWITNRSLFTMGVGIASSADGSKAFLCSGVSIYVSTNSGVSWFLRAAASTDEDLSIACSADGTHLITVKRNPKSAFEIHISTNFGISWTTNIVPNNVTNSSGFSFWSASSADGSKLVLTPTTLLAPYAPIYTYGSVPIPQLNLAASGTNLALAWTVPSTNFVVQQSADLFSWVAMTNQPVLNLSNLQYQIQLAPTNNNGGFYRLATP